jgi:predicted GH43/DUF377 family glycosyl hydrolase
MISASLRAGKLAVQHHRMGVVMEPDGSANEVEGVLNPGVTRDREKKLLLFPRIVASGNVSRIGLARLGLHSRAERVSIALEAQEPYELRDAPGGHGCEDARVTFIAELGIYAMAYTAYGPTGARIAVAISDDAYAWRRLGLVHFQDFLLNAVDNKDAAFFPDPVLSPEGVRSIAFFHRPMRAETINGQTPIPVILALPPDQREAACIAYIPVEDARRDIANLCAPTESVRVLEVGETWGMLKNGAGTPPIRTTLGWLSVFHGVDAIEGPNGPSLYYSAGILINDLQRPHVIVYRSPEPDLTPQTSAERFGTVDNVVFPTGIDEIDTATFDVYYGAADAKISRARFEIGKPPAD